MWEFVLDVDVLYFVKSDLSTDDELNDIVMVLCECGLLGNVC